MAPTKPKKIKIPEKLLKLMQKDAKKDRQFTPRSWSDVEHWRYVYDLDFKEVIKAMEEYWIAESKNMKGARGFQNDSFKICEIIESYRHKHSKFENGKWVYPSVEKAITNSEVKLKAYSTSKSRGISEQEIDKWDQLHRRLVKNKPRVWEYWLQCRQDAKAANKKSKNI
jgi:hypothetical protein